MSSPSECGRPSDEAPPLPHVPRDLTGPAPRRRRPRSRVDARRGGPHSRSGLRRTRRLRRGPRGPGRGPPGRRTHGRGARARHRIDAGARRRLSADRRGAGPPDDDSLPRGAHAANHPDARRRPDHLVEGPADGPAARRHLRGSCDHAVPERPGHRLRRAHHRVAHQATAVGAGTRRAPGAPGHHLEFSAGALRPADRPVQRGRGHRLVRVRYRSRPPRRQPWNRRVQRFHGHAHGPPRHRRGHADHPGPRDRRSPHAHRRHGFAPSGRTRLRRAAAQPPGVSLPCHPVPLPQHDR